MGRLPAPRSFSRMNGTSRLGVVCLGPPFRFRLPGLRKQGLSTRVLGVFFSVQLAFPWRTLATTVRCFGTKDIDLVESDAHGKAGWATYYIQNSEGEERSPVGDFDAQSRKMMATQPDLILATAKHIQRFGTMPRENTCACVQKSGRATMVAGLNF